MIGSLPPTFPGRVGQILTALQLIVAVTSYANETNPETRAKYSKFASNENSSQTIKDSSSWPSKLAMFVIYAPALLSSIVLLLLGSTNNIYKELLQHNVNINVPNPSTAAYLCTIHFSKRVAEVLFLHHYSGRTDRGTPTMISVYYTFAAILVAYAGGSLRASAKVDRDVDKMRMALGISLYALGILGNFYHHYLLARLRSSDSKQIKSSNENDHVLKTYVAPKGGLFSYVAAPHYLFELLGWTGIAIVSDHLNVYLLLAGMTSYLAGRSVAQNEFNRKRFNEKDWPTDRKNLIPFVF
jgi:very-long-chain enoyl-CoA reductase